MIQREDSGNELPALNPDAIRMILYTSGTTGRSKGVLHSHNSIHALICQIHDHWLVERGDKFLVPSPIGHIGGSIYAFECPLLLGTTAVLMDRWNADAAVGATKRDEVPYAADTDGRPGFAEIKLVDHNAAPAGEGEICARKTTPLRSIPRDISKQAILRVGLMIGISSLPDAPKTSSFETERTSRRRKLKTCSSAIPTLPKSPS